MSIFFPPWFLESGQNLVMLSLRELSLQLKQDITLQIAALPSYLLMHILALHTCCSMLPSAQGAAAVCDLVNDSQVQPSKLDLMPVLQYCCHQNRKEKSRKTAHSTQKVKLPIRTKAKRHVNTKRQTSHLTSTHLIQFGACVVALRVALCQLQGDTCPDMQLFLPKKKVHKFELLLGNWKYNIMSRYCCIFDPVLDIPYLNQALEEQHQEGHSHLSLPHLSYTPCHYSTLRCKANASTRELDP